MYHNGTKSEPKPNQTESKPNQTEPSLIKTGQKNRIIALILENPIITRVEIAEHLGIHESSVQRRLEALVKEGKLRHNGPTNGGSWEVINHS